MEVVKKDFYKTLFDGENPCCVAFVGGGGKTTTIKNIANELASQGSKVVITTTTKMHPPDNRELLGQTAEQVESILKIHQIAYGGVPYDLQKMTGLPQEERLNLSKISDYVLVEADGSRRLPLKMIADYEPVVPVEANYIVVVVGLDCVGGKLGYVCHRSELATRVLGKGLDEVVSTYDVAKLLKHCYIENPTVCKETAGLVILFNKADDDLRRVYAEDIEKHLSPVRCVAFSQLDYLDME